MSKDLTSREKVIFNLLVDGFSPKEIAGKLNVSNRTVEFHRTNIYSKLGVHSIQELIAKYKFNGTAVKPEAAVNISIRKLMLLISLGILIIAVSVLFVLRFIIKPSGQTGPSVSSGEVTLSDGTIFITRTFDVIYLRASRFVSHDDENLYGENYGSHNSIKFADIYPAGFDKFIPPGASWFREVQISGTVDIKLDKIAIDIQHAAYESYNGKRYTYLGGTIFNDFKEIGPGNFSVRLGVRRAFNKALSELPPGEVEFHIVDYLFNKHLLNPENDFDSGRRIPDDIPNDTIMATIRGLKIEPVIP